MPLCRKNESLFAASGSHDQDGRHAHIVGRFRQLIELLKVCNYLRSMIFLALGPRLLTYEN